MKRIMSIAATIGLILSIGLAGSASAHHVISLGGTVDCEGDYSVTVEANVFGSVTLTTTLNGAVIGSETPGGPNADHEYTYTGSGAAPGDPITAKVSDSRSVTEAVLVLTQEACPTPTPSPTPTASPSASPSATPTATPAESSAPTPPPTDTEAPEDITPPLNTVAWFFLVIGCVLTGAAAMSIRLRR